jgi:TonB-dependent SusC/RagA subfamily outer membrane receptor
MKKLNLFFFLIVVITIFSCSRKSSKEIQISDQFKETTSDGYTSTTVDKKLGAGSYTENSKTILPLEEHLRSLPGVSVKGFGATASVTIRGVNSFNAASQEPLFVLNGQAMGSFSSVFSSVQPAQIKRVTALTDAASTSIYGVRGANGVILITLKN